MKKYEIISNMDDNSSIVTGVLYIGTTADIKALCKSIRRASEKESTNLYFLFGGAVRFSENKQMIRFKKGCYYLQNGFNI